MKRIYSFEAACISSLLFTASIYFNIICGLFILPDTPQILFLLLALYYGLPAITNVKPAKGDSLKIILFGLFTGLAFLSKYHELFLWFGFGLYILLHDRSWLKRSSLFVSIFVTLIMIQHISALDRSCLYWHNHFEQWWLNEKLATNRKIIISTLLSANALVLLLIILGIAQINGGLIFGPTKGQDPQKLGKNDVTLDMYGWHRAGIKFQQFLTKEGIAQKDYDCRLC